MYIFSDIEVKIGWSRYIIDEMNSQFFFDMDIIWEIDESCNKCIYKKSLYSIVEVGDVKRYLLDNILVIKIEMGYLNLVLMINVVFVNG